ncbi:Cleavage and polyadenylation specificity factor subunit 1 [Zea mays]|uniref:Cleavage and polyadenylation specificity factor subunit 1 n=1 Tax=Zea mays TaxID=4577 RepID=A0A1D6EE86_MAIZE|nr:Cleavage and polyadenylation specificity factor subunit 1 [Zea mays]
MPDEGTCVGVEETIGEVAAAAPGGGGEETTQGRDDVKNFVLFGDIHKSIYFLSWKEQGSQLSLLAKDFGSLDCFATEFLIDGSTLSLVVSDSDKNVQVICPFFCIN